MRKRRLVGGIAAVAALTTTMFIGSPGQASASYPSDTIHYCGSALNIVGDDGPVTDGIHHNVEPLLGGLDNGLLHAVNCGVLATFLRI